MSRRGAVASRVRGNGLMPLISAKPDACRRAGHGMRNAAGGVGVRFRALHFLCPLGTCPKVEEFFSSVCDMHYALGLAVRVVFDSNTPRIPVLQVD